jgi:uncharacterized iron-regulated protein
MKNILAAFAMLTIPFLVLAQDKPAYKLFTGNGDEVRYSKMIKELQKADFVFFGEEHNNPISHWLELEVTRDLYESKAEKLMLGAEMFESDNQVLIDEFFSGLLPEKKFTEDCRLWKNYPTDYKPLLMFAKEKKLPFIATNVPRRYASLVASKGLGILDSLSVEAKAFLPPLPIVYDPEVACYKNMMDAINETPAPAAGAKTMPAMPGAPAAKPASATGAPTGPATAQAMPAMPASPAGMAAHNTENLPKAQALKDATMAWFINKYYKPGRQFIHYNGSYHSDNHEGIIWYLKKLQPNAKILVITTSTQDDINEMGKDDKGKGDFVIVVPSRMTTTY